MACGRPVENGEGLHITKIVQRNEERGWVALERRTILCGECERRKSTFTIPNLVNSFRLRGRLDYLFRVVGARLSGRISTIKMRALLYGFSLRHGGPSTRKVCENKRMALLYETGFRFVYCGCALGKETMTIDHMLALSRSGTSEDNNCVASCGECNNRKANTSVSAFIDTFPDFERRAYLGRVKRLERQNQISREKAQRLLGRCMRPYIDRNMRILGFEINIRVSKSSCKEAP